MGAIDGHVLPGVHTVLSPGPLEESSLNILLVGDGYTAAEIDDFAAACSRLAEALRNQRWFRAAPKVHLHRIDVVSRQSGASVLGTCNGGTPIAVATYFDAKYGAAGLCRFIDGDDGLVQKTHDDAVRSGSLPAACSAVMVLVNSDRRGGALGSGSIVWAPARHPAFLKLALHEFGHFAGLADEYDYFAGCGKETDHDVAPASHNAVNVSNPGPAQGQSARPLWDALGLIDPATPIPTMSNPDPTRCDRRKSPVPAGTIGAFEGAFHYHSGCFRPAYTCRMRTTASAFCKVCELALKEWLIV